MKPIDSISNLSQVTNGVRIGGVPPMQAPSVAGGRADGTASGTTQEVNQKKRLGIIECETCANRTYQDGSDDMGVSFKAPTKLDPNEAATKVAAHEMEHYTREASDAKTKGKEVISNSVQIFTSVCSECGRTYVSGGETTTVTKDTQQKKSFEAMMGLPTQQREDPNSLFNLNRNIANQAYGLSFEQRG